MNNYKIRVGSEAESKEAQELFFELGYSWLGGSKEFLELNSPYLYTTGCGFYCGDLHSTFNEDGRKEITLPQLRDMVVLKRNSIEDATHESQNKSKVYVSSDDICYSFSGGKWEMFTSGSSNVAIKPIGAVMKEYLDPRNGYKLIEAPEALALHAGEWILVPDGCNIITCQDRMGSLVYFHWKSLDSDEFFLKGEKIWSNNFGETLSDFIEKNEGDVVIIWQRHNQPEELSFIDDEPTKQDLIDLSNKSLSTVLNTDLSQPMGLEYMDGCSIGKTQSLNDQYAEIEKARQATKETEYLMQGKNGEKLMESLAQFHNTDRGADFDNFELLEESKPHSHYFIDVSDVDEVDFYEIALRYNVTDPCIQHILKKCLAVGNRGHKDLHTDIKDIYDTAKRALNIHGLD